MTRTYDVEQSKFIVDKNRGQIDKCPNSGYAKLNAYLPAFLPGSLTVVSGLTSMGKTTLLANMAANIGYLQKKKVLFISLESGHNIAISISNIESRLSVSSEDIKNIKLIVPESKYTLEDLRDDLSTKADLCDICFIDHIHYFGTKSGEAQSVAIGNLVRDIQLLAKNFNIPIVLVAHVRKLGFGETMPTLNDLKDTSSLSQDPSTVIFVHRDTMAGSDTLKSGNSYYGNEGYIIVAKNRDFGRTGPLCMTFNPETLEISI